MIKLTKFVKTAVNKNTGAGLRQIVVAIMNLDKELRVTEHINLE